MDELNIIIENQEQELLPVSVSNFDKLKTYFQDVNKKFVEVKVEKEDRPEAKKSRASINKLIDNCKEVKKFAKNHILEKAGFPQFEKQVDELVLLATAGRDNLDTQIKGFEDEDRIAKQKEIEAIFLENVGSHAGIIEFIHVFDSSYLNISTSIKSVTEQIVSKINTIKTGLQALESLKSKFETTIKSRFLESLDLAEAVAYNNQLIENEARLEAMKLKAQQSTPEVKQEQKVVITRIDENGVKTPLEVEEPTKELCLKMTLTPTQQQSLRGWASINNVKIMVVTLKGENQ